MLCPEPGSMPREEAMASRCARLVLLFTLLPAPGLVRAAGAVEKDAGRFPRLLRFSWFP